MNLLPRVFWLLFSIIYNQINTRATHLSQEMFSLHSFIQVKARLIFNIFQHYILHIAGYRIELDFQWCIIYFQN